MKGACVALSVYEHSYRPFTGRLTPIGSRFLVPTRYAFRQVFSSRLFLALFVGCFAVPLGSTVVIYLHYNLDALSALDLNVVDLIPIDARFFRMFMIPQGLAAFLIALIVGPSLVSPDLRNNALPLYLSRPFSRRDYVLGKLSVLLILLSLVTWVPGLFLCGLQSYLAGGEWLKENLRVPGAIFLGSWMWILVLSIIVLMLSALVKRKPLARILFLGAYFISTNLGHVLNGAYNTWKGSLLVLDDLKVAIWDQLFGVGSIVDFRDAMGVESISPWAAWITLGGLTALCLWVLVRRIRAYEVVT